VPTAASTSPGSLVVAEDVLGGRFAVDGGELGVEPGTVCYFGPDSLSWVDLGERAAGYGGTLSMQTDRLDRLDAPWRERHRRLWIFLVGAPYIIIAPMLLLLALGRKVPDAFILSVALVCLALLVVYMTVGFVWLYRVYSSGRAKMRTED
jgi:Protein of unknown function DUF2625